ncbi:MAG: hypothetical protein AAF108_04620 [Planctomycetota bacterium]
MHEPADTAPKRPPSFAAGLDAAKPERLAAGVFARALAAAVLWFCFDDRLSGSFIPSPTGTTVALGEWSFWNVVAMTAFLATLASAGGLARRSS